MGWTAAISHVLSPPTAKFVNPGVYNPKAFFCPLTPHCPKMLQQTTLLFPQSSKLLKFPFVPQLKVPSSLLPKGTSVRMACVAQPWSQFLICPKFLVLKAPIPCSSLLLEAHRSEHLELWGDFIPGEARSLAYPFRGYLAWASFLSQEWMPAK